MSLENEFAKYLSNKGFERFMEAWKDKYERLGHLGGKITLDHLLDEEIKALSGLLGLNLSNKMLTISYTQFIKKVNMTKYSGVDFFNTLELWNKAPIYCRKENKQFHSLVLEEFKESLLEEVTSLKSSSWLSYYFEHDRFVTRYFDNDPNWYRFVLIHVCHGLEDLPIYTNHYELLPIFAQKITKNPHFFDDDLPRDLLLKGIMYLLDIDIEIASSQEVFDILYKAGILKDDLSNYCPICHITPVKDFIAWKGFYDLYEPWNMNLYNINQVTEPFHLSSVMIFENPSVFRTICTFAKLHQLSSGFICSNGQINICTYILLEKLIQSGCILYYTGDYDPEGLLIADKLKQRYGDKIILWGYKKEYFHSIKIKQMTISPKRMQILKQIQNQDLREVAKWIIQDESFGYQEGLIHAYQDFLLEIGK